MASPQVENGYTRVANELLDAMIKYMPNQTSQCQVFLAIIRKTYGWGKPEDYIPVSQIKEMTQLSRRTVIYAIQNLEAKNMITVERKRGAGHKNVPNKIKVQKKYNKWVVQGKSSQYDNALKKQRENYNKSEEKVVQGIQGGARIGPKVVQGSAKKDQILAPSKERKKTKEIPSDFFDLSKRFHEYQQKQLGENLVKTNTKTIETGAAELEKLVRLDGFNLENEIRPALQWGVQDDFWSTQLRSLSALRRPGKNGESKFKNLYAAYKRNQPKTKKIDLVY